MNYKDKRVLVVGMARSGVAAAQLLCQNGAVVTVNDSKSETELGDSIAPLEGLEIRREFGRPAAEVLNGMDVLVISPGIPDTAGFVVKAKEMGICVFFFSQMKVCYFDIDFQNSRNKFFLILPHFLMYRENHHEP